MSLYAISDLHLSLSADKPMDVFTGWQDYVSKIEKNWLEKIKPDDYVAIPGDVSWAMSLDTLTADFDFINRLPGTKFIMKGNHDFWWTTMAKMNSFLKENRFDSIFFVHNNALPAGRLSVCGTRGWLCDGQSGEDIKILAREVGRLEASLSAAEKLFLEPVAFLHYPPLTGGASCRELLDVLKRHNIRRCFYGHLHGKAAENAFEGFFEGIEFKLVSCDHLGFSPLFVG